MVSPQVVLVWPQVRVTPWLKSLSQRFHRELRFAQVRGQLVWWLLQFLPDLLTLQLPPSVPALQPGCARACQQRYGTCRRHTCPCPSLRYLLCLPCRGHPSDGCQLLLLLREAAPSAGAALPAGAPAGPLRRCVHRCVQVRRVPDSEALLDHYRITQVPSLAALTAGHRKVEYTGGVHRGGAPRRGAPPRGRMPGWLGRAAARAVDAAGRLAPSVRACLPWCVQGAASWVHLGQLRPLTASWPCPAGLCRSAGAPANPGVAAGAHRSRPQQQQRC